MTHYEQCCARECQYCALGLRRTTPIQNVGGRLEYSAAYHTEVNDDGLEIAIPCTAPTLAEFAERCAEALAHFVKAYDDGSHTYLLEAYNSASRALGLEK